jgi:hypothetical protein
MTMAAGGRATDCGVMKRGAGFGASTGAAGGVLAVTAGAVFGGETAGRTGAAAAGGVAERAGAAG